jgi:hypothetical protein
LVNIPFPTTNLGHEEFFKGNDFFLIKTSSQKEQEGEEILCFLFLLDEQIVCGEGNDFTG